MLDITHIYYLNLLFLSSIWLRFYIENTNLGQGSVFSLNYEFKNHYNRIDLIVVSIANLINLIMVSLFVARMSGLLQIEKGFGIIAMLLGFTLGYIAFLNYKKKRDIWTTYLLAPISLFFIVELVLDYLLNLDFRNTVIVGPYILLYYIGLRALIGYSFKFNKKWGFFTLATYFGNMILSILPYI